MHTTYYIVLKLTIRYCTKYNKMDKLMETILPKDAWELIASLVFRYLYPNTKYTEKISKHECIKGTFVRNINYMTNENSLILQTSRGARINISPNIGLIKYLGSLNLLSKYSVVCCGIFYDACETGNIETLKYLTNTYKLCSYDALHGGSFQTACSNGHLGVLEYLNTTFKPAYSDIKFFRDTPIECACINGHLEVLKYLIKTYKLKRREVINYNKSIVRASRGGYLEMLKYLVSKFKLKREDIIANKNVAFVFACKHGRLDIVKYLVRTFSLTCKDATSNNNEALRLASENGHSDILMYLESEFGQLDY